MRRSSALALPAILAALAHAAPASAFCRTAVCDGHTAQQCTPSAPGDCGIPLAWPSACVGYSIQEDASEQLSLEETTALFEQAFATWTSADCGGGTPRIQVTNAGPVACTLHEYNQNAANANIIVFRDEEWPHEGAEATLALTTVTYNLENGEIYDADMELNSANVQFTTSDMDVEFDFLSVITHEAGHFLGLAHSMNADATMNPGYMMGSVALRDLTADDVAGICAVYPPGEPIGQCDPTPRHGFSGECAADQEKDEDDGCGVAAAGAREGGGRGSARGLVITAIALLGAAATRRRSGRRQ